VLAGATLAQSEEVLPEEASSEQVASEEVSAEATTAEEPAPEEKATEEKPPDWRPPADSTWDWVQLTSGEWLKGSMDGLRDRKMLFDSDKLDDLVIDWDDVRAFYLKSSNVFRLESGENLRGQGVLRDDVLVVTNEEGSAEQQPRSEIVSIIGGDGTELANWSGYASAEFGLKDGNTDQVDLSGTAGLKRETEATRWKVDYRGIYGKLNGEKTSENHRVNSGLDVFLTSRLYVTTPFFEYYKDEFLNVKTRATPGMGIGYEFVRNRWVELDVLVGGAYQYTKFEEVQSGEDEDSHDAAAVLNATLNFDLPRGVELDNLYRLNVIVTDTDKTSHHFESVLSADVWGPIDLDVTFIFDRIEKPEPDSDGNEPDSNDIRVLAGLSVDF
jgi:hypothetical protein